jgi:integrase
LYAIKRIEILAPDDFAGALTAAINERQVTTKALGKSVGLAGNSIHAWMSGRSVPSRRHENKLKLLEGILKLPENHLVSRISSFYGDLPDDEFRCQTPHRKSLHGRRGKALTLRNVPDALKSEWLAFLDFKTKILPRGIRRSASWRLKQKARMPTNYSWAARVGGMVCPSAELNYKRSANVLGFLVAPADLGGKGLDDKVLTLASLADPDLILEYLEYQKSVSGAYNGGTLSLIRLVRSMLRPEYGYLWQHSKLFGGLFWKEALDAPAWRELCSDGYYHLGQVMKDLRVTGQIEMTRPPAEPIQAILNRQHPISALLELVEKMEEKAPHAEWGARRATFMRDLITIKLLIANPLRAHHLCIMTYRKDNTGNLFQMPDGSWWLKFAPQDFKNQRGAAKSEYKMRLSPSIWDALEEYLKIYRPMLAGAGECDYVLRPKISSKVNAGNVAMMTPGKIGTQLQKWTFQFIPNCPGFRAHAFRHIVATDFIKNHPQSFMIAATILHDKIETVMENYAHLKKHDEFEVYNDYLEKLAS